MDQPLTFILGNRQDKKHSVRFDNEDKQSDLKSIYLGNVAVLKIGNPSKVKVTVEKES